MQMIRPAVQDPVVFLSQHLQKDLEQLTQSWVWVRMTRSAPFTCCSGASCSHATPPPGKARLCSRPSTPDLRRALSDNFLSTKEARHVWENIVIDDIIMPQLKNLEQRLKEVNDSIRCDSRVNSNPVMKVVYGDPCLFLSSLQRDSLVHRGAVWSCRERVSLLNLMHVLEQNGGNEAFPLLWIFLQMVARSSENVIGQSGVIQPSHDRFGDDGFGKFQ
ncbi:hypothetical protein GJAV_G00142180 [Gymnothorax javanicus]|nr:hypothetical protein GJAV_G00142180 [Gymnothorax javanicus]